MADPRLVAVVTDLMDVVNRITSGSIYSVWSSLDDLSDEAAEAAVAEVVPIVRGAQRQVAAITANYVSRVTGLDFGAPQVGELIPEATWNRSPIGQARRLFNEGNKVVVALDTAARRAAQVHSGDVLRARNDAATALSAGTEAVRPLRWAKVPSPSACTWCRSVATKLYYRPDGLPVHLHDRCGLDAVTPAQAGQYANGATMFGSGEWRSRVKSADLRDAQRAMAATAAELAAQANRAMLSQAA